MLCSLEKDMNQEEFKKLAEEWQKLNEEYDACILSFLSNPDFDNDMVAKLDSLREMQKKLFNLEDQCFRIAEGKIKLDD